MRAILIAEKPSLMREIEKVYKQHKSEFNFDIDFLSQAGHLVGLKLPSEINPEKYAKWKLENFPIDTPYEHKVLPGKTQLLQQIKTAVHSNKYDFVIHAGDPDGEGELLVNLVLRYVKNPLPVQRFWTNDITENAIVNALHNLKNDTEYKNIYHAALVRRNEDYQFGMNITGVASLKLGELYKLGRVKAAIIRMGVDRERAIRNFVEKCTFKRGFTYQNCEFLNETEFDTENLAKQAFPPVDYATVLEVKKSQKEQKAPKLYQLSTLQSDMYAKFGISGGDTLAIIQKLYEARAISYPRTDCEYVSSLIDFKNIIKKSAVELELDDSEFISSISKIKIDKTYVNDTAIASKGHTAIIPTGQGFPSNLGDLEYKVYLSILRRFLAIFAKHKIIEGLQIKAQSGKDIYTYKDVSDIECGYELILNPNYKQRQATTIPFSQNMTLRPINFIVKEFKTKPPARYNDGSLIKALDKPEEYKNEQNQKIIYSIGTPATRHSIIEQCVDCGYFTKKSGVFYATEKAERVIDELGDISLFNITNSAEWENMLEQIRHGEVSAKEIEEQLYNECRLITEHIKSMNIQNKRSASNKTDSLGKCPNCGGEVVSGKFGAYCINKCGMSLSKAMGKKLTDTQVKAALSGKKFKLSGLISHNTGKPYDIYLISDGIEDYSYTDKSGQTIHGKQFVYKREFVNNYKK